MKINIYDYHIEEGKAGANLECPVALALLARGFDRASVGSKWYTVSFRGKHHRQMLPQIAIDFIKRFDSGLKCLPFEFELELPCG